MPSRSFFRLVFIGLTSALYVSGSSFAVASVSVGGDHCVQAPKKAALQLTDADRKLVVDSVSGWDTGDTLPAGFDPAVGAKISSQKMLPIHPVPPPASAKVPVLKSYDYAKLPDKILLIDPMTRKVAE